MLACPIIIKKPNGCKGNRVYKGPAIRISFINSRGKEDIKTRICNVIGLDMGTEQAHITYLVATRHSHAVDLCCLQSAQDHQTVPYARNLGFKKHGIDIDVIIRVAPVIQVTYIARVLIALAPGKTDAGILP